LGEVKTLAQAFDVTTRAISDDLHELQEVLQLLEELSRSFDLSPSVDNRSYFSTEITAEFGVTTLAVIAFAKRRGVRSTPQRRHFIFSCADIEAMRIRGKGGRPRKLP